MTSTRLTYTGWATTWNHVVSCTVLVALIVASLAIRQFSILALFPVFLAHVVYAWVFRRRKCPIAIEFGGHDVTFLFADGSATTWNAADIDRVDFRRGDLVRPFHRVATFCRKGGGAQIADANVKAGESELESRCVELGLRVVSR